MEAQPIPIDQNWTNILLTMLFGAGQAVMSVQDESDIAAQADSQ
jgi:hypothetical protein